MSLGLLGRKVGMMRIFTDDGDAVPVMRAIKQALDPLNVLNPGKVLRA